MTRQPGPPLDTVRRPGGGGYGDPSRRERKLIEGDMRNGYATPEAARRDHGWRGSAPRDGR